MWSKLECGYHAIGYIREYIIYKVSRTLVRRSEISNRIKCGVNALGFTELRNFWILQMFVVPLFPAVQSFTRNLGETSREKKPYNNLINLFPFFFFGQNNYLNDFRTLSSDNIPDQIDTLYSVELQYTLCFKRVPADGFIYSSVILYLELFNVIYGVFN